MVLANGQFMFSCSNVSTAPLSREEVKTIGPDIQNISMLNCYNKQVEDELLKGSGWERDGYYPFDIASLAGSCVGG